VGRKNREAKKSRRIGSVGPWKDSEAAILGRTTTQGGANYGKVKKWAGIKSFMPRADRVKAAVAKKGKRSDGAEKVLWAQKEGKRGDRG